MISAKESLKRYIDIRTVISTTKNNHVKQYKASSKRQSLNYHTCEFAKTEKHSYLENYFWRKKKNRTVLLLATDFRQLVIDDYEPVNLLLSQDKRPLRCYTRQGKCVLNLTHSLPQRHTARLIYRFPHHASCPRLPQHSQTHTAEPHRGPPEAT